MQKNKQHQLFPKKDAWSISLNKTQWLPRIVDDAAGNILDSQKVWSNISYSV